MAKMTGDKGDHAIKTRLPPRKTGPEVLDSALQAIGEQIEALRRKGELTVGEGQLLAAYANALSTLERNQREALKQPPAECSEEQLLDMVALEIGLPAEGLKAMVSEFRARISS